MKKGIFLSVLITSLAAFITALHAQTIVTLNGNPIFDTSALTVIEAGNDFPASISEIQGNTSITITNRSVSNPNNYNYHLSVRLENPLQTMQLSIVRTGTGTNQGGGSAGGRLTGGTTPIVLDMIQKEFFSGSGDRYNVPVRFGISNISVLQTAGSVPVSITFTVTGN